MAEKQQDIDDLFSMFHDFSIASAELDKDVLTLGIIIPWGEMWNIDEYKIRVELVGCSGISCTYHPFKDDDLNRAKPRVHQATEQKITTDPGIIATLGLDVQRHSYNPPNTYVLHCNSTSDIAGGELTLTATDLKLYDRDGLPLTLDKMKQWGTDWWDGIQKMWDEQKKGN